MASSKQIRVSVAKDGTVRAETLGFTGPECLHQVAALEDMLDALTVSSSFTADFHRTGTDAGEGQAVESGQS